MKLVRMNATKKVIRERKLLVVKSVRQGGAGVAQASRNLDTHENVLRKWVGDYGSDPAQAFPGHVQMSPSSSRLRDSVEVAKLKAERAILIRPALTLRGT